VTTQATGGGGPTRALLVGGAGLFIVSSSFPVAASVLRLDPAPRWLGVADVVVAFALVVVGMVIVSKKPTNFDAHAVEIAFRAYRILANALLFLFALFLVIGDSIDWNILLPGLAWRAWLLVLVLPSWIALWPTGPGASAGSAP
jgi:hypothetical protein